MLGIIILTKNNVSKLKRCLNDIFKQSLPIGYHIYIGDTGTNFDERLLFKNFLFENNFTLVNKNNNSFTYLNNLNIYITIEYKLNYHFSKNNNYLFNKYVKDKYKYVLFLNNDVYLNETDVLEKMLNKTNKTSICGLRLLYLNNLIQHDGIKRIGNGYIHVNLNKQLTDSLETDYIGCTGACLMMCSETFSKFLFNEVFNDCMQDVYLNHVLTKNNYTINIVRDNISYHDESSTRKLSSRYKENILIDLNTLLKVL